MFPFQQQRSSGSSNYIYVVKTSSSALLTMARPEISDSHEEEVNLLKDPQALWTVLAINTPPKFAFEHEPAEFYTPIAQFTRAITASLRTQRFSAGSIHDKLKVDLDSCDPEGLYDDGKFTKSTLYHRAVKICDELAGSITSSLRFLKRTYGSQGYLSKLCANAHDYEIRGVEYWVQQLQDEMFALEELHSQISLLCSQVHERVSFYTRSNFCQLTLFISAMRYEYLSLVLILHNTHSAAVEWSNSCAGS